MCEEIWTWTQEVYTQVQGKGSGEAIAGKWRMSVFQWVRIGGEVGMAAVLFRNGESGGCWESTWERRTSHSFQGWVMDLTLTAEGSGHRGTWIQQK